jgi:hypothetical protein
MYTRAREKRLALNLEVRNCVANAQISLGLRPGLVDTLSLTKTDGTVLHRKVDTAHRLDWSTWDMEENDD